MSLGTFLALALLWIPTVSASVGLLVAERRKR